MTRLSKSAVGFSSCLVALCILGCAGQPQEEVTPAAMAAPEKESPKTFAVYTLSRGKGVPAEAREVMRESQALVERDREAGIAVRSERTRLGLEGETRLCIDYEDQVAAGKAFRQIEEIAEGVDLVNLVAESCMKDSETPKQGTQKED